MHPGAIAEPLERCRLREEVVANHHDPEVARRKHAERILKIRYLTLEPNAPPHCMGEQEGD